MVKNIALVIKLLLSLSHSFSIVGKFLNFLQNCENFKLFLSKLHRNDLRFISLRLQLLVKLIFALKNLFKMKGEFDAQGFRVKVSWQIFYSDSEVRCLNMSFINIKLLLMNIKV